MAKKIRACAYCGEDTKNEWIKYCCYHCEVYGEKEKTYIAKE